MYEKKAHSLAPKNIYYKRLLNSFMIAVGFLSFSLVLGLLGYHYIGELPWIDSLVNASMILGGMGPVDVIKNNSGKVFTSIYAIYSGVSFLTAFSILIAPAFHRLLHKFHLGDDDEK
jgi:hypothetical protein